MHYANKITFFERFEADILSGKKTITIRDESEKNYSVDSIVQVSTYEDDRWFCALKIKEESKTMIVFTNNSNTTITKTIKAKPLA